MDRLSLLPDDLLFYIWSLVPLKDVIVMSACSKQFSKLWKQMPNLEYDDSDFEGDYGRFLRFVDRSLILHEAEYLESLRFKIGSSCGCVDINRLLTFVVRRCVHELEFHCSFNQVTLPRIFYIGANLVVLKLEDARILYVPFGVCLPSLKTLCLRFLEYPDSKSFSRFLSSCPNLEDLNVVLRFHDNVTTFTIEVPTLQSLSLDRSYATCMKKKFEIDTPSLKYLDIDDYRDREYLRLNIPGVVKANIMDVADVKAKKLFSRLTSVQELSFIGEVAYPTGCILHRLENLVLNTFSFRLNLVIGLLKHSPKLRIFELFQSHDGSEDQPRQDFEEPNNVPECLLFHLETFKWSIYFGAPLEKDVAKYILQNARCLKTATFFVYAEPEAMEELELWPRGSDSCQIVLL